MCIGKSLTTSTSPPIVSISVISAISVIAISTPSITCGSAAYSVRNICPTNPDTWIAYIRGATETSTAGSATIPSATSVVTSPTTSVVTPIVSRSLACTLAFTMTATIATTATTTATATTAMTMTMMFVPTHRSFFLGIKNLFFTSEWWTFEKCNRD